MKPFWYHYFVVSVVSTVVDPGGFHRTPVFQVTAVCSCLDMYTAHAKVQGVATFSATTFQIPRSTTGRESMEAYIHLQHT